ncbi:tripartite tricarboxylate transporter TctB family protein [Neobacillus terrae]|uniref:tripartite tricarboxylate transporter TctB family protein n=1 Tax=Neobacillus terrae TaxID=3034837 RepID=UPI00140C1F3F|nr:tripartite tricarboxylate transporter TctB family protein [Neobacillus terrae]NHM31366.1 tripartite tricarboxylate transporter TctB family protein [Neobacillus terrae]
MRNLNAQTWAGVIILLFGVLILIQSFFYSYSSNLGPGPGMFPLWLSGILILLSIMHIVKSIKKEGGKLPRLLPKGNDLRKLLKILSALVGFTLLIPFVGFTIAGFIFLFILLSGEYKWYSNAMISIGVTALMFWVFNGLLSVPLPVNYFGF